MKMTVEFLCMTTKQKFEMENPTAVKLANGRFAYKVECPWTGKGGKQLYAFKFCSASAYEESQDKLKAFKDSLEVESESEHLSEAESEQ